jgi:AcrR family transcriptional regulator
VLNKSRGRPPGKPDTRGRIVAVARERFLSQGYAETSMRSIARDAGVDPALLNYHFGSKDGLFSAVMELTLSPPQVLARVLATGGPVSAASLIGAVVDTWDHPDYRGPLVTLLREVGASPEVRRAFSGFIQNEIIARIAEQIGGPEASKRAAAVATSVAGLVFGRYVLELEPLASMSKAEIVHFLRPGMEANLRQGREMPLGSRRQGT